MKNSIIVLALSLCAFAANAESVQKLTDRAQLAADTFQAIENAPDKEIPNDLLAHAYCIATIPQVTKVAFFGGGAGGKGLVSCRTESGTWSEASYAVLGAGSIGLQFGVSSTDLVFIFTRPDAINTLDQDSITLTGNLTAAFGPFGRNTGAGTDWKANSWVLTYDRVRGFFAGFDGTGSVLTIDHDANRTVYGGNPTAKFILSNAPKVKNNITASFLAALPK